MMAEAKCAAEYTPRKIHDDRRQESGDSAFVKIQNVPENIKKRA